MVKLIAVLTVFSLLFATRFSNAEELKSPSEAPAIHKTGGEGSLTVEDCPKACDFRCSKAFKMESCLFYCNLCCKQCLCVPSGTYGNKEECPCYNNWKNKSDGPKCP
ncbi:gibberellin-regulated protein 12 [Eutrema salsugineum]|uniref:gibberellin-regulated protein 12 n=1 Tax=Eutrema salsugineum TaxID=72664 RepID=UPI000CED7757|nr:gibberellin-regulated protein 12 [Eutrema salsugineum]